MYFTRVFSDIQQVLGVSVVPTALFWSEQDYDLCRAEERRLLVCFDGGNNDEYLLGYYTVLL
jgi:hypothetical protein